MVDRSSSIFSLLSSLPVPRPANYATREKQIPFREEPIPPMKKHALIFGLAVITDVVWFMVYKNLPPLSNCQGFACGPLFLWLFILYHIIIIPLIFGVVGYLTAVETPFKQSLRYFGLALLPVIILIVVSIPMYRYSMRQQEERASQEMKEIISDYEANPEKYKRRPY